MASVVSFPFIHPVLLTLAGLTAVAVAWSAPVSWRNRRWWPVVSIASGAALAGAFGLAGVVPWLGELHLAAYAICMLGGFLCAWLLIRRRAALIGMSGQMVIDCLVIAIVLGVIGARVRYVYERWDRFLADAGGNVQQALVVAADLDRGGAVWYGGALLASMGVLAYLRWRRIAWLPAADMMMPAVLAGLAVGRVGCWFNGCCYGAPTTLPWGVGCTQYPGQWVHPTQLYESLACLILAAGLWWFWCRRRSDGQVTVLGLIGYGLWRFANEGMRGDHDAFALAGRLTTSQLTSILVVVGALVLALVLWWRRNWSPLVAERATRVPGSRYARESGGGHAQGGGAQVEKKGLPSP
jgi:phosphatidylglycerol:prolipoprotein diacylglycerol transferase